MLKGRTILLTGATGLIGGEFLRLLAQGSCERILCLVRPREGLSASKRLAQRLPQAGGGALSLTNEPRCAKPTAAATPTLTELPPRCRRKPSLVHVSTATVCGMA